MHLGATASAHALALLISKCSALNRTASCYGHCRNEQHARAAERQLRQSPPPYTWHVCPCGQHRALSCIDAVQTYQALAGGRRVCTAHCMTTCPPSRLYLPTQQQSMSACLPSTWNVYSKVIGYLCTHHIVHDHIISTVASTLCTRLLPHLHLAAQDADAECDEKHKAVHGPLASKNISQRLLCIVVVLATQAPAPCAHMTQARRAGRTRAT